MAGMRVGAGGCEHRMVCVLVAAVGAAVVMVAVNAAMGVAVVVAARALLVGGMMMAVAVDRRQPEDGRRHGDGKDDF
jgi:hypothetical protein